MRVVLSGYDSGGVSRVAASVVAQLGKVVAAAGLHALKATCVTRAGEWR